MTINRQIGWSQEAILLHGVSKQLERLAGLIGTGGGSGSTAPLELNPTNSTVWNNGAGGISSNTSFGEGALSSNTTGVENVAYGGLTLNLITTGYYNTAVGYSALSADKEGKDNTAIGNYALSSNIGSASSTLLGSQSTAVGSSAMTNNTTGNGTSVGAYSLYNQTTGLWNIAIGMQAGSAITIGSNNVILASTGFAAVGGITTGSNNMILAPNNGNTTGITTGSGNIVIGKVTGLAAGATNTITIADGVGNIRQKFDTNGQPSFNALHTAPATATSAGTAGEFRFTSTGLFLCIATNTWVKATLATF